MKKFMIALAFVSLGTVAANAQQPIEAPSKYTVATNGFWHNWFLQVGVDATMQNPYGVKLGNKWHDGRSYGIDLAIGKWFTPGLGIRLKANWENGLLKREHANSDFVYPDGHTGLVPTKEKGGYGMITGDVLFNLSNLFCGYSDTRVWNMSVFPRAGVLRNFGDRYSYAPVLGFGLESAWRISKRIGVYLDVAYNLTSGDHDTYGYNAPAWIGGDLGLTFNLGKTGFQKAVTLDAYNALAAASEEALARLRADLDRERALNADLRAQLAKWANHVCAGGDNPVNVVSAAATSVFFDINSSKLNSTKDLINLQSIAAAAKAQNAKVVVTGFADSKTGSAAYNQKLSEARAQAVADELVKQGVARANITVAGKGGVSDVEPFNLNRRAVVTLK